MRRFNEKVVIITGADSELGSATALRLAREGANIVLIGIDNEKLSKLADELPEDHTWINSGNHLSVTSDISNHKQTEELVKYVVDKYQRIDAIININTVFSTETPLLNELSKTKGNIVDVSVLFDTDKAWNVQNYIDIKNQLVQKTADLALTYSAKKIRNNAVMIGLMVDETKDQTDNDFIKQSPFGELIKLEDAVEAITFLADEDNRLLTGVTLPIDGGLSLKF